MQLRFKDLWAPKGRRGQKSYVPRANFMSVMRRMPPQVQKTLTHPNIEKAPWHVQFHVLPPGDGYCTTVNVWPHLCKWQVDGEKAVVDNTNWTALEQKTLELYTSGLPNEVGNV